MRPRCSILTGGFDFSGCGDCTSCPPFEHTGMSNNEPSAIVLQGIRCMCGLYKVFDSNGENGSLKIRRDSHLTAGSMLLVVAATVITARLVVPIDDPGPRCPTHS